MKTNQLLTFACSVCACCAFLLVGASSVRADTYTVTNTDDTVTAGTLRQAITDANAHGNGGNPGGGADRIEFAIPGSGVRTITITSGNLPIITDPVVIDGTTQGPSATPLIEINANTTAGFQITAGGCTMKGLAINRGNGCFNIIGTGASGNVIQGNYLGVDPSGTSIPPGNLGNGISINDAPNTVIGGNTVETRNIISGNRQQGIIIFNSGATGTVIRGNFIGTNAAGTAALPNEGKGISALAAATVVGGNAAGEGNLISGNGSHGIEISGGTCTVQGNFIGTDVSGTNALSNSNGVVIFTVAGNNLIGGDSPGARNLISGNRQSGVSIVGGSPGNLVQGNYIGTDVNGTAVLGNTHSGIYIDSSPGNIIGLGTAASAVYIGIGNASGNEIRGAVAAGNVIAGNTGNGLTLVGAGAQDNQILGNSIFSNGVLGIDLEVDGVTPNDLGDGDTGANQRQNFPVLTSASTGGASTTVNGTLNSVANTSFRLEFFANSTADPTGNGEGQTFLGSQVATTDGGGNASFNAVLPTLPPDGQMVITSTATDPTGNTSEFSGAVPIGPAAAQAQNISTRLRVESGSNVLIGGFIVGGSTPERVVVRGIGPSLSGFGVPDALVDPIVELRDSTGSVIVANDNWQDDPAQAAQLTALGLGLSHPMESGIVATLDPNAYTAILAGKNETAGVGLVEMYDTNEAVDAQFANISTRGFVGSGDNVMIGGFILGGNSNTRVVIRGIGPSLADFGLSPVLEDPTLELRDSNGTVLVSNQNWQDDPAQAAQISSFGLAPTNAMESGIYMSLPAGAFTAILAGNAGGVGIGLVEVYNIQ